MVFKIKQIVLFITILILISCGNSTVELSKIEGKQLPITDSLIAKDSISTFVAPYREHINAVLDSALAYAPHAILKTDGRLNSTAGNLLADIVLEQANPVFNARNGKDIDLVVLNFGGIRSGISQGKVSARTAYEVMPFENSIVVMELDAAGVSKLVDYLAANQVAHPISGLQLTLDAQGNLDSFTIQGEPLDSSRSYFVATSSYLANGGDRMDFFKEALGKTETDYMIRKAMIDYFSKVDTIAPRVDNRFIQLQ